MMKKGLKKNRRIAGLVFFCGVIIVGSLGLCGCSAEEYCSESLFSEDIESVYVEMFDNQTFIRDVEYKLTEVLAKQIEASTPYKIISDRNRADTVISGQISSIGNSVLSLDRETGRTIERERTIVAVVSWKNLKTGELLIDHESVSAAASYSVWQSQGEDYSSTLAANNLAKRIVERMEKQW